MNLVGGEILSTKQCDALLDTLESRLMKTLASRVLDPELVIRACDRLVTELDERVYLSAMAELGIDEYLGRSYISEARQMFGEAGLRERLRIELGENFGRMARYTPMFAENPVTECVRPLGVLLHIAAGNMDGLPAFSVLEGLITGNVNILKLPAADGGITIRLMQELIRIEPLLSEYIYVFDYSSRDIVQLEKLVNLADAVVVWGGDAAVSAFRKMVRPETSIIEWGHKLSFAYVTIQGITQDRLAGLARNIVRTGQLLCSSCQGIFIDTDEMSKVFDFCERFLPVLEKALDGALMDIGIRSQVALQVYTAELESVYNDSRVFKGNNCSLTAYQDKKLTPSIQFGNAWVRPLPKAEILPTLRPYKNYLQTAGLLCRESEQAELTDTLWKTGVVRVCSGERMSETYCGAAHDGQYPLRRYTKVVSSET